MSDVKRTVTNKQLREHILMLLTHATFDLD
jgi:hypothetical protein